MPAPAGNGCSLTINGNACTLLDDMTDVAGINRRRDHAPSPIGACRPPTNR
jgi:hypothetical protein